MDFMISVVKSLFFWVVPLVSPAVNVTKCIYFFLDGSALFLAEKKGFYSG